MKLNEILIQKIRILIQRQIKNHKHRVTENIFEKTSNETLVKVDYEGSKTIFISQKRGNFKIVAAYFEWIVEKF